MKRSHRSEGSLSSSSQQVQHFICDRTRSVLINSRYNILVQHVAKRAYKRLQRSAAQCTAVVMHTAST
eukprot:10291-Heterococcus_DN1.PRE.3